MREAKVTPAFWATPFRRRKLDVEPCTNLLLTHTAGRSFAIAGHDEVAARDAAIEFQTENGLELKVGDGLRMICAKTRHSTDHLCTPQGWCKMEPTC